MHWYVFLQLFNANSIKTGWLIDYFMFILHICIEKAFVYLAITFGSATPSWDCKAIYTKPQYKNKSKPSLLAFGYELLTTTHIRPKQQSDSLCDFYFIIRIQTQNNKFM